MTRNRYFLYLDILGFSDLVKEKNESVIHDLYEVIASINAHQHNGFKVIVFSDTVIVYNINNGDDIEDSRYLIMFLCEFAKDLMHRLTGRGIFFRAVINYGDFTHYELNGIPCFFGNALIEAFRSEKELKAIGLFIHKDISSGCDIFQFLEFNENYHFVYMTQTLAEIEYFGSDEYPLPAELISHAGSEWYIYPEISHLSCMLSGSMNTKFCETVREKYAASWEMYCRYYPNITRQLVASNNDVCSISPSVNWQPVIELYPDSYSYAIQSRVEF